MGRPGRRPGPLPRGTCPACQRPDIHLRADGTIGSHRRLYPNGYTRGGHCAGIGQHPAADPAACDARLGEVLAEEAAAPAPAELVERGWV